MKRLKQFIDQNRNENDLLTSTNTIINYNNNHKEKILNEIDTSSNTFSQSQINFFSERPNFYHLPFLEEAFKNNSYEIFQFLDNKDINNLRKTNKFFWDICDCYFLFDDTIQSLSKFFSTSLNNDINDNDNFNQNYNYNYNNNNNDNQNYNNNNNNDKYEFVQQKNINQQKYNYPQNDNYYQQNNNYYQQNNNYGYQDNKNYGYQNNVNNNMDNQNYNQGNNNFDGNLDNLNAEPGVMKVEASERFIYENGVKKKLTKIKKYMESGEVVEEIYKTDL